MWTVTLDDEQIETATNYATALSLLHHYRAHTVLSDRGRYAIRRAERASA